ncbi:flagellar basal body rod protein FlgB [uncultured Clostridium sp.]|uniref:flagellar basal body rod protein FlgB n=1 Tax=uncultured Clostridium sp. TaxID=59620 RepID=UPI003216348A
MSQNEVYGLLKKSMNVTVEANKAIANNIANVNMKDYKRYYVPFEQVMEESTASDKLKITNEKHIGTRSKDVQVKRDDSTSMREDGNNVDIESEMTSQASNTMMYESLVRFASGKMNSTSRVIKGGN